MNSNKEERSELARAVAQLRPFFVRGAWFSVATSLLVLAPTGYMLQVYERVVNSRSHATLLWLTVLVLAAYVLMEVLEWARAQIMHTAANKLDAQLHERVFKAMFEANVRRTAGGTQQTMADLRQICSFLYSPALLAIMEAPVALVMMVLLFMISPVLGWTAIAFGVMQMGVTWLNERCTKPPLMEANKTAAAAQQYADNTLRNTEVIESMGMLHNLHRRWMQKQQDFLALQAKASDAAGGFRALSKFLQTVLSSTMLGLACWLLLHNMLNGGGGMMIIASILGGRMLAPLVQVVSQWSGLVNARDAWNRLNALLTAIPAQEESMSLPAPKGHVQVEQIIASAPGMNNSPILRGVAFALQPGDVLGVVGPSAAGKTTLVRLLVGLWPTLSGKVRLDGADIKIWNKAELGPYVGYLPQGVELFEGTVAENIARFGEVDMAKVEAAARMVGVYDLVIGLPKGFETRIGLGGMNLSGGQRQRVALARAFYGEPAYIVLDEPNSSLDDVGEQALVQAVAQASACGATVVVVTHRTGILKVVNKMLVLADGQQQAFGPRDSVLAGLQKAQQQRVAGVIAPAAGVGLAAPQV